MFISQTPSVEAAELESHKRLRTGLVNYLTEAKRFDPTLSFGSLKWILQGAPQHIWDAVACLVAEYVETVLWEVWQCQHPFAETRGELDRMFQQVMGETGGASTFVAVRQAVDCHIQELLDEACVTTKAASHQVWTAMCQHPIDWAWVYQKVKVASLDWKAEAIRRLPPRNTEEQGAEPVQNNDAAQMEKSRRNDMVLRFKRGARRAGIRVTDEMIAKNVSHNWTSRTTIAKWKSCSPRVSEAAARLIEKYLTSADPTAMKLS